MKRSGLRLLAISTALCFSLSGAAHDAFEQAKQLDRGINVLGYDPIWNDPASARFTPPLYRVIHDGGFQTVRVNLQAFAHMDAQDYLDATWLRTLDDVIAQATAARLNVIVDEHDFHACAADASVCRRKLLAFWTQVAPRYRNAPASVYFELLNEPGGALTPPVWNGLLEETLAVVRRSNPGRTVIVGPANGNAFRALDALQLPEGDRNIVVTVHYYDPFRFTHQGAPWARDEIRQGHDIAWGSQADRQALYEAFDRIAAWGTTHRRPIFLGEFGTYEAAPTPSRVAWTVAVVNAAEKRHIPWAYWQFEGSLAAYDIGKQQWIEPIHAALVSSDHAYRARLLVTTCAYQPR